MKKRISSKIFVLSSALLFPVAGMAETFWAPGVSESGGWFDMNKVYNPCVFWDNIGSQQPAVIVNDIYGYAGTDYSLCWAATCANILQYLYVQAGGDFKPSSTYNLTIENKPNFSNWTKHVRQSEFMEVFVENFQDMGGYMVNGISWYATGKDAYDYSDTAKLRDNAPNKEGFGYFSDINTFRENYIRHYQVENESMRGPYILSDIKAGAASYAQYFQECISESPIGIGICSKAGDIWHAITCWGYETDENGNIVKIYVVDSDDGIDDIKSYGVKQTEDGYLSLVIPYGGEFDYYLGDDDSLSGYYGCEEASDGNFLIMDISGYKNFFVGTIPEPSFFGVFAGMAAIALAGTRRRRKL